MTNGSKAHTNNEIEKAVFELGKSGSGLYNFKGFFSDEAVNTAKAKINDLDWQDGHKEYVTASGNLFRMERKSYGARIRSAADVESFAPFLTPLLDMLLSAVIDLSEYFPILTQWQPDESSVHVYDKSFGLGFHRDERVFSGIIANISLGGLRILETKKPKITRTLIKPGDLFLMRATNLYKDDDDYSIKDNPLHAVTEVPNRPSITVLVRSLFENEDADLSKYNLVNN